MLGLDVLTRAHSDRQYGLRLDTFIRLRWLVVIGQTITLVGVRWGLGFDFPIGPTLGIVAVSAATNLALRLRYPRPHRLVDPAAGFLLAFDVVELSGLLYFTGGLDNPFFAFFLAPFLISATALAPLTSLAKRRKSESIVSLRTYRFGVRQGFPKLLLFYKILESVLKAMPEVNARMGRERCAAR